MWVTVLEVVMERNQEVVVEMALEIKAMLSSVSIAIRLDTLRGTVLSFKLRKESRLMWRYKVKWLH
jgi:hypothetical protein